MTHPTIEALRETYADIAPGKVLDTKVKFDKDSTDVMLSDHAVSAIGSRPLEAKQAWEKFLAQSTNPIERAIAERAISEAILVDAAYGHMVGEIDRTSDVISSQEVLFGHYSEGLFRSALLQKYREIEALSIPDEYKTSQAIVLDRLHDLLGDRETIEPLGAPTPETLEAVHAWLEDQFGDVLLLIEEADTESFSANEIIEYFQICIDSTPALKNSGWEVERISREKGAVSVYAGERKIVVPTQKTASKAGLKKLLVHEVFGHALRSAVAEEHSDGIGRVGTSTYQSFEESFEIALEQCLDGIYNPKRGIDHYVAIGLSVSEKLSKDAIGHLFKDMNTLRLISEGKTDKLGEISATVAAGQIRRSFAGMTDVDDGVPYRKGIDYLHGLHGTWKLLNFVSERGIVDESMRWLLSAKFNPYNALEREHVSTFTPMPVELVALFANHEREKTT